MNAITILQAALVVFSVLEQLATFFKWKHSARPNDKRWAFLERHHNTEVEKELLLSNRNIHIQHTQLVFWQLHLTCHPSSCSALIDQSNTWSQNSWRNTIKAGTKNKTSQRLTDWCLLCQTDSEMFTDKLRNEEFAVANVAALITCYFCSLSCRINRLFFSSSEPLSF